jgi:N-acetylglucosaminyl-diphospho-decaprenol L-rhamnosyltransferase
MSNLPSADSRSPHDVAVIIVGLNARNFVCGLLDSLLRAEWRCYTHETIYVDNGSTDGTVAQLRKTYPWVTLIENGYNAGYCKAANQGARRANSRYYYFINDDTIVLGDAISLLVEYMDAHPEVATAGSRLLYPDGSEQYSGRRFPTLLSGCMGRTSPLTRLFPNAPWVRRYLCKNELARGEPFPVDWVSAAGQIFRPPAFWQVGGYAEDYYYWHEAVLCGRLASQGKKIVLHPASKVIHYEGKGSGHRPYSAQKFHILDFHRGAYRFYCEQHHLGKLHPARWLAGALLASRAALQLGVARLRKFAQSRT